MKPSSLSIELFYQETQHLPDRNNRFIRASFRTIVFTMIEKKKNSLNTIEEKERKRARETAHTREGSRREDERKKKEEKAERQLLVPYSETD